ncbi:MAG: class I SAM-dependent methyltransferase [Solirubrobacterales bacterium]
MATHETDASAAERAATMLDAKHASAGESWPRDSFLDLLGEDTNADAAGDSAVPGSGFTQALMNTRIVPTIYERWWRPGLARVAKGVTGPGMAEEVRIARLLMGLSRGDTVLDVACGPGNFSREFARDAGESGLVVGLDGSRTMLERGAAELRRSALANLALVRGDATALPFEHGSFDGVCCFAAIHLFADPYAALDEMARVLRPGGRIALMASVRRRLTLPPLKPVIERASGMRLFEPGDLTGALAERGFTDVHQRLAGMVQFVGGRMTGG